MTTIATTEPELDPAEEAARAQLIKQLEDPSWRLENLYKIVIKGDDQEIDDGLVLTFKPNRAQKRLMLRLWHRNVILKARQLGFTTLVCILWLDTALFSKEPIRCGIIAQDREAAEAIFRGKVQFAYDRLPDWIKEMMPLARANSKELEFAHNGSSIRVATSMRSGTIHRLLVSEFGKICAKAPDKAREVMTGSIPAVPKSGILIIESTAEGQDGSFYDITKQAQAKAESRTELTQKDYAFHFFAWWMAPEYMLDPAKVLITDKDHDYFNKVEAKIGRQLPMNRRAWYVATRNADFQGDPTAMWQEYPSYPDEAFQVSTEGCYYAENLALARKQGRVVPLIPVMPVPAFTFWDIGKGDMTSIWVMQRIGMENRFIRYYEESGEDLDHFTGWLQKTGLTFARHYIPHEAEHKRIGKNRDTAQSIQEMLEELMPGQRFDVVSRTPTIQTGITATRNAFSQAWFCETGCAIGLKRLTGYKKEWNDRLACWKDTPLHNMDSHGSDAFRQWAQKVAEGEQFRDGMAAPGRPQGGSKWRRRRSGMAV
jgi:hypothetical protein